MVATRIVVVSPDIERFDAISQLSLGRVSGQVVGVADVDDLPNLLSDRGTRLIVLSCSPELELALIACSLLHISRAGRPIPIVVIGDDYDSSRVLTAFRMGVADYLAWSHHFTRVATVLETLIEGTSGAPMANDPNITLQPLPDWFPGEPRRLVNA